MCGRIKSLFSFKTSTLMLSLSGDLPVERLLIAFCSSSRVVSWSNSDMIGCWAIRYARSGSTSLSQVGAPVLFYPSFHLIVLVCNLLTSVWFQWGNFAYMWAQRSFDLIIQSAYVTIVWCSLNVFAKVLSVFICTFAKLFLNFWFCIPELF